MLFRLPEPGDKAILQEYVQEHYRYGETSISASMGLTACEYLQWVEKIQKNASCGDASWGRSLLFLCFHSGKLIGLISIRYELPQPLAEKFGHIGYGVRPSERNKGYATRMLQHAVHLCKQQGMESVILGCYKNNAASAKTIVKNGGVLTEETDRYEKGRTSQYYLIRL